MESERDALEGMDKLLPIRDALQQFELEVREAQQCLLTLLANDEDMIGLLLTEQESSETGSVDLSRHVVVEIVLESYVVRLTHTLNSILFQQQKVKSRQEVAEFSVQMQRNRILRMNLHTGVAGVSIGVCAAVGGLFGMNVTLPSVPPVFDSSWHFLGDNFNSVLTQY